MPSASVSWGSRNHLVAAAREHRLVLERDPEAAAAGLSAGELLLMALGACVAGTLRNHTSVSRMPIRTLEVRLEAYRLDGPSRYDDVTIRVLIDGALTDRQLATVERVASACRVHNSLHGGIKSRVSVALEQPTP